MIGKSIKAQAAPYPVFVPPASVSVREYLKWGDDNRYPHRLLLAVAGSGTASVCVEKKAKIIQGNGFNDDTFYQAPVNRRGQTADDLLGLVASDLAALEGFALLVNINANGHPGEVLHVPFEKWRPTKDLTWCFVVNNTKDLEKTSNLRRTDAVKYRVFDPRETPESRLARIGGPDKVPAYGGEVYVYFHRRKGANHHPRPIDAVLVDLLAEAALKRARHNDAARGFTAKVMITEIGNAQPTAEQLAADDAKYSEFIGPEGGEILLQYAATAESKPLIEPFKAPDAGDRYVRDGADIQSSIRRTFELPDILYGDSVAGKLGQTDEFDNAVRYAQRLVVNIDQRAIERGFKAVFSEFQDPDNPSKPVCPSGDYAIQNLTLDGRAATGAVKPTKPAKPNA